VTPASVLFIVAAVLMAWLFIGKVKNV